MTSVTAEPGFSRLALNVRLFAKAVRLFDVRAGSFVPAPEPPGADRGGGPTMGHPGTTTETTSCATWVGDARSTTLDCIAPCDQNQAIISNHPLDCLNL